MFETAPRSMSSTQRRTGAVNQQPRRLALALSILLLALLVLLVKDRQFWFGTQQATIDSDLPETSAQVQNPAVAGAKKIQPAATASVKKQPRVAVTNKTSDDAPVSVTRTVLPPLDVEVVAGDKHHRVHPPTSTTHVELQNPNANVAPSINAAEREPLPATPSAPQASVNGSYPMLAQHMNVQGAVILQAMINADGLVEDLRVVSGPAILSTAAKQAVREWRFKPVVQNGHAVETQARITVNFNIKVADNSASTTVAESRASDILVISR
jgi:TonB family protein